MNDKAIVLLLNRDQIHTLLTNHDDFSKDAVKMAAKRKVKWEKQDLLQFEAEKRRMEYEVEIRNRELETLQRGVSMLYASLPA